jgi:hypothetical protein
MSEQSKVLPPAVDPVRGVRVTVNGTRRASNWQFRPFLLDGAGRGRNPMELSRDLLTAAGHPKRSVRQVRHAFACNASGQYVPEDRPALSRLSAVPAFCRDLCGEGERRSCAVTDCPMWAYRFGDPHSGARGNSNGASAWKRAGGNAHSTATMPSAGVAIPDNGKGAENAPIDAPASSGDDASTPATALRLSDAAQSPVACTLRAASAHQKGKCHG